VFRDAGLPGPGFARARGRLPGGGPARQDHGAIRPRRGSGAGHHGGAVAALAKAPVGRRRRLERRRSAKSRRAVRAFAQVLLHNPAQATAGSVITYEYPLNERIRTLLRLEDLYDRVSYFLGEQDPHGHHACLTGMFEILEVASRADLKSDLLQELDRQRSFLEALRSNPAISEEKLNGVLKELASAFSELHATSGKTGQGLRENEWLMAIKQRVSIPGGTSEFDLPSYHHWLHHPAPRRRTDLESWLRPLLPVHAALSIVLRV